MRCSRTFQGHPCCWYLCVLVSIICGTCRKNQQLKTFTHTLQVFLTALRLHTTLISLPVSLNHKAFLIRFLWLDLTRALTQQVNQATHSTSPHIIKGLFLCLVRTTSQFFIGAYAIHTLFSSHSLRLPSHESTSPVFIKSLAHLKSAAAAAFQTQTFSHVSCLIYHTTSLRKLFHICCCGAVIGTRCLASLHTIGTLLALGTLFLHVLLHILTPQLIHTTSISLRVWAGVHVIILPLLLIHTLQKHYWHVLSMQDPTYSLPHLFQPTNNFSTISPSSSSLSPSPPISNIPDTITPQSSKQCCCSLCLGPFASRSTTETLHCQLPTATAALQSSSFSSSLVSFLSLTGVHDTPPSHGKTLCGPLQPTPQLASQSSSF